MFVELVENKMAKKRVNKKVVKNKDSSDSFFRFNYRKCFDFLKESKNHIYFMIGVFFVISIIGFIFPIFFKEQIFDLMRQLSGMFDGLNIFQTIALIFLNNLKASFMMIFLGFIFGIVPIFSGINNGYLLGFVARYSVRENGVLILWRILPHGVFELPAIFISMGLGLKIGIGVLLGSNNKNATFKRNFKESMRVFLFIILPLLIVAATIEGFLVYYIK